MAKKKLEGTVEIEGSKFEKAIGEFSRDAYLDYGEYVNCHRHLAYIQDGVKVSYRRLIYAATQFPKGRDIPSTTLISSVAAYHPHGLTGIEDLNANLVKSGIFSGSGFFGSTSIDGTDSPHAAPRYTKNRLSDLYWDLMGRLIKEVPYVESPVGALEPEFLPTPLPMCLYMKNLVSGLGVGISTIYPNFSPESLYQAYIHNNPELLEPNVDLFIDKANSELKRLWETGKGRVIYSYKISRSLGPDGKTEGILFEGDTGLFTPSVKRFGKLQEEGKVFMEDMTDIGGPKLFIGRVPGARGITIDDIEGLCRKICYSASTYVLNVTDGKTAFRIPLYDWLDISFKNYNKLITAVNKKRIEKTKFDIVVLESTPAIVDYVLNKNPKATDKEIQDALGLDEAIVSAVMSKPISTLRKNKDNSARLKDLKALLKELRAFDPVKYTEEIIKKM